MKLEDRDRLNYIRGIAHSIGVSARPRSSTSPVRGRDHRPHLGQRQTADDPGGGQVMANGYINIAHLYKRMPVLTDTNGDHLIAVSDLRTAIAMAAAETGEVHPMPCKIGDKIYEVTKEPGERIDIDEYTVSEVGLNGVFTSGGWPCYRPHRRYFTYADEGVWWFFKREDAEAERKRRNDP